MPLFVNLIGISKYDAFFEVKRFKTGSSTEDPSWLATLDIPVILHKLIQIAYDE